MLEVDLPEAFQAGATWISRTSCLCLVIYRKALATPLPSRTIMGESRVELRETAIDIGRTEVEAMQGLLGVLG